MRLCLMLEGQEDIAWGDWLVLARACEQHGFEALFTADHYASVEGHDDRGGLDAWTALAGVAAVTSQLRIGTLVSPVTFRHPAVLAKSVATVDHISGGRVELGMGGGWMAAEHERFGFPFPPMGARIDMLAEQLELVRRQWGAEPFSFDGDHYRMRNADPRPKPVQSPHPPLIVGGSGGRRSIDLAARWADEYNTGLRTAGEARELRGRLAGSLRFSLMASILIGADRGELVERARRHARWRGLDEGKAEEFVESPKGGWIVGTADKVARQLGELADAGVDRVVLKHHLHQDLDVLAMIAAEVAPQLR